MVGLEPTGCIGDPKRPDVMRASIVAKGDARASSCTSRPTPASKKCVGPVNGPPPIVLTWPARTCFSCGGQGGWGGTGADGKGALGPGSLGPSSGPGRGPGPGPGPGPGRGPGPGPGPGPGGGGSGGAGPGRSQIVPTRPNPSSHSVGSAGTGNGEPRGTSHRVSSFSCPIAHWHAPPITTRPDPSSGHPTVNSSPPVNQLAIVFAASSTSRHTLPCLPSTCIRSRRP